MSYGDWQRLLARFDGEPRSAVSGVTWLETDESDRLTVDHIVPRSAGGSNDISNLQFLTRRENSAKGPRPDSYWQQVFYWDHTPNLAGFRCFQREYVFEMINSRYRSYFARPRGEISGLLYLFSAVVGGGKTLAIPATVFAYNRVQLMEHGPAAPRADRVLVLTPSSAIRDQIKSNLGGDPTQVSELVRYGITGAAPSVHRISHGDDWGQSRLIDQHDLCVACIQQLWTRGGSPRPDLSKVLASFPIIFIDEMHYSFEQIMGIVSATDSLVFGLTGTPIKGTGETIKACRLVSVYDYDEATRNDRGLKFISPSRDVVEQVVEEINIDTAVIRCGDAESTVETTADPAYEQALAAIKSVGERVAAYLVECDRLEPHANMLTVAKHRTGTPHERGYWYPMHAMISVSTKEEAKQLAKQLNTQFDRDRVTFPREMGYTAAWVVSGDETEDLTQDHAWLTYKRTGKLQQRVKGAIVYACRILVVVGIGREGVSNEFCGVIGVARQVSSLVEAVQRWIGRTLRSPAKLDQATGRLHVPPARMDIPKIILHRSHGNRQMAEDAIDFVCNMASRLSSIPALQIDDSLDGAGAEAAVALDPAEDVSNEALLVIAQAVQKEQHGASPAQTSDLINLQMGASQRRRTKAEEWAQQLREDPSGVAERLLWPGDLPRERVVMRESPNCTPSQTDLERFIRLRHPDHPEIIAELEQSAIARRIAVGAYEDWRRRFHIEAYAPVTDLTTIQRSIGGQVLNAITKVSQANLDELKHKTFSLVGRAINDTLGSDGFKKGGEWDCPQYHSLLNSVAVRQRIVRWVQYRLIAKGYCPELAEIFDVLPDDEVR